ncbi:hypothetical protein CsatB_004547 [Cannabis sativa]
MADTSNVNDEEKRTFIFSYGTLKRGFQNYNLTQNLISQNDAVYIGDFFTYQPIPLVIGIYGIPYLINLPGSGQRIKGELYSVTASGLALLDDLEGVAIGHYERLPIQVVGGDVEKEVVSAEAYFAHRSFGNELWKKNGEMGLSEYSEIEGRKYVLKGDRVEYGRTILDDLRLFLAESH